MFQFQLLPSLGDLSHVLFRQKYNKKSEKNGGHGKQEKYWTGAVPLGPALGSPVWHGVSGSPRELNCVERSLQRDLPSAPHSQPGSERQQAGSLTGSTLR